MSTLLAQNVDILVAMNDKYLELSNTALFARDGIMQLGPSEELPQDADVVLNHRG